MEGESIDILLVEDNPGDVTLTRAAFQEYKLSNNLFVVKDGEEALEFLHREGKYQDAPRPGLILLDLNLPRKDGREVLKIIKDDEDLKSIPVVVLTTSDADTDILKSYELHANCFITKPVNLDQFLKAIQSLKTFWLSVVKLPKR